MIYEASIYYDKINAREKPREGWASQADQWRVFQTEQEAKDFIILRAREYLAKAESELRRRKAKLLRVCKRFATPCEHGFYDSEECGFCDDLRHYAAEGSRNAEK